MKERPSSLMILPARDHANGSLERWTQKYLKVLGVGMVEMGYMPLVGDTPARFLLIRVQNQSKFEVPKVRHSGLTNVLPGLKSSMIWAQHPILIGRCPSYLKLRTKAPTSCGMRLSHFYPRPLD